MKLLIIGSADYAKPFRHHFKEVTIWANAELVEEADVCQQTAVLFTGGEDVDPDLYGEQRHGTTHTNISRDVAEAKVFHWCKKYGVIMYGICRGAQLLTVLNDGKLVQNVGAHATFQGHGITTVDAISNHIDVVSTHHQMMYPFNLPQKKYSLLAYSKGLSGYYEGVPECEGTIKALEGMNVPEPEAVMYPDTRCIGVQFHPEREKEGSTCWKYFHEIVRKSLCYGDWNLVF